MLKLLTLVSILWTPITPSFAKDKYPSVVDLTRFEKPLCLVGKQSMSKREKVNILREHQASISRKTADFRQNKLLERKSALKGTAKNILQKHFKKQKLNWVEQEFGYLLLTLFGEARNLDKENIEMVARVINNRKGQKRTYEETVTELAQFSSWYYKNQFDNVDLLCPDKKIAKNWDKVYRVAVEQFRSQDDFLKSKFYFAPHNMFPKHKLPRWSKGKHAVGYGGHVFLVSEDFKERNSDLEVVYIPANAKKMKVRRGKITLYN